MPKQVSRSPSRGSSGKGGPLVDVVPESFDASSLKELLRSLAVKVLRGEITPRAASTVRGLIRCWLTVDEHEKWEGLSRRIEQLELERQVQE